MPSAPQPAWSGRGQQQAQYRHKAITLGVTLDRLQSDAASFIARHNKDDIFPHARACTLPEGTSPSSITILAQISTLSASQEPLMYTTPA
jgi:hypothetical protein